MVKSTLQYLTIVVKIYLSSSYFFLDQFLMFSSNDGRACRQGKCSCNTSPNDCSVLLFFQFTFHVSLTRKRGKKSKLI